MKQRVRLSGVAIFAGLALTTGCGGASVGNNPVPKTSGRAALKAVQNKVATWHTTAATVDETVRMKGQPEIRQTLHLTSKAGGRVFLAVQGSGPAITEVTDGHGAFWYRSGQSHYLLLPRLAPSSEAWRLLGRALIPLLANARVQTVKPLSGSQVALSFPTTLAGTIAAQGQLVFDMATGAPVRFRASWPLGTVTETVVHFQANPVLNAGQFQFSAPAGVSAAVTLRGPVSGPQLAQGPVGPVFPVAVPPTWSPFTLKNVSGTLHPRLTMLTFTDAGGSSLLLTEGAVKTPPASSGLHFSNQVLAGFSAKVAALPLAQEMVRVTVGKTPLWLQGTPANVRAFLEDWAAATPSG